jgi:hypothetical protein
MCPSEIGVQYQPDGRLSTLPKNTATLTGKLLIVPHSAHNTCQKLSNDFSASNPADLMALEELIALAKDIRAARQGAGKRGSAWRDAKQNWNGLHGDMPGCLPNE